MSDPTIKVYLEAKEIRERNPRTKRFDELADQQILIFKANKLEHYFGFFELRCVAVADPSSAKTETLPEPFVKGFFSLDTDSKDLYYNNSNILIFYYY